MSTDRADRLLLVEDDDVDAMILYRILLKLRSGIAIERARNGEEALVAIQDQRPDLILLDINMPRMNGLETLAHVKGDTTLRDIPIVMLSTSTDPGDIRFCHANYANAYMIKGGDLKADKDAIAHMLYFWFDHVIRPVPTPAGAEE